MKKLWIIAALVATPALAQQQDPQAELFRRAIGPLQQQRNMALDDNVNLKVQLDKANEDLMAAKARIQELEAKLPKDPPKEESVKPEK